MVKSFGIGFGVPFGGGSSDPIQTLTDAYISYVEGQGGVVVDESAVYDAIDAAVTAGEVQADGTNTKEVYQIGYKFGMIKDAGTGVISKMFSLFKVGASYPEFTYGADADNSPIWTADYIKMYEAPFSRYLILQSNMAYAKNSFYIEIEALRQYVSSTSYPDSSVPTTEGFRQAIGSTHRVAIVTYNLVGNVAVFSNNNYFINDYAVYKTEYIRTGDSCVPKLYRDGVSFQDLASRTWDRNLVVAFQEIGSAAVTNQFRSLKIAQI